MRIKLPKYGPLKRKYFRLTRFTAALCLVCFALAQGASQTTNTKRITALQLGESAEGSRVTVTGDSLLDDYEAFRRGDRFYVRIPGADFVAAVPGFQGRGFEDVQVQRVGNSVVISFRLQPGADARVTGVANRLDVIFTSPNHFAGKNSAAAVRNRVTRNVEGVRNQSSRSAAKVGSDVAGPIPPNSPGSSVDSDVSNEALTRLPQSRSSQRDGRSNAVSTQGAAPAGTPAPASTPVQAATPYPSTSPYSAPYSPASSIYTQSPVQPVAQTTDSSVGFESRSRAVLQQLKANKIVAASVAIGVICLLGVVIFLLYRKRRNRRAALAKASRVQPKYSPDDDLEDMPAARLPSEYSRVSPGRYVDEDAYENWDEKIAGDGVFFEDLSTSRRTDVSYDDVVAPTTFGAPNKESWEHVPESNPQVYKNRVQEEREVFEL